MEIGTKIDVLEDDISSTDSSNLNIGKEEASISKDVGGVGIEQRSPKFSFHQSNMLYILFLLGFASCIILDVLVQFHFIEKDGVLLAYLQLSDGLLLYSW